MYEKRLDAIAAYFPDNTIVETSYSDSVFVLDPYKSYEGTSPSEAIHDCNFLIDALAQIPGPTPLGEDTLYSRLTLEDLKIIGYKQIHGLLQQYAADDLKIGIHTVLNTLYFLISCELGKESDRTRAHALTLREAYNKLMANGTAEVEIVDRRQKVERNSGQYLVLTDEEADAESESYVDEQLEMETDQIPDHLLPYMNTNKLRNDISNSSDRGTAIAPYDNEEIDLGNGFFAYRIG